MFYSLETVGREAINDLVLEIPHEKVAFLIELGAIPNEVGIPRGFFGIQPEGGFEPLRELGALDAGLHSQTFTPHFHAAQLERSDAMISLSITSNAAEVNSFLVKIEGEIKNPRALNAALGNRLADELQDHFRARNREPNKMAAVKTNFWSDVASATKVETITDHGVTVVVADVRVRVHVFGGTIVPTNGRKFLTIPLVKDARGMRVAEYESKSGHKLFRLPGTRVLAEKSASGDRSLVAISRGTIRGKGGVYRKVGVGARAQIRVVFALAERVTIKQDPRALPPTQAIIAALTETGNEFLAGLGGPA